MTCTRAAATASHHYREVTTNSVLAVRLCDDIVCMCTAVVVGAGGGTAVIARHGGWSPGYPDVGSRSEDEHRSAGHRTCRLAGPDRIAHDPRQPVAPLPRGGRRVAGPRGVRDPGVPVQDQPHGKRPGRVGFKE